MRLTVLAIALWLLVTGEASAQDEVVGPPPDPQCESFGIDDACARARVDFWNDLLRGGIWSPGYDYGEGDILLTADRDMRDRYAIALKLPSAAGPQDTAWMGVAIIQAVGLPWIAHWEGRISLEEGRRLMAQADRSLATLPPPDADGGCLHAIQGAIERRRGRTLLTRAVDFCLADGELIHPTYSAFILAAQSQAAGCLPPSQNERADIRSLYNCLRLQGDRASAREVRELALARLDTLSEQVVWDYVVFGGGDFVTVSGWWIDAPYPPPEVGRRSFSEIWRRREDGWVLDQTLGETPPYP